MEATQTARWRSPDQNEPSARARSGTNRMYYFEGTFTLHTLSGNALHHAILAFTNQCGPLEINASISEYSPSSRLGCFLWVSYLSRSRPNWIAGPRPKLGSARNSESRGPENGVSRWRWPNSDIYSQNDNFGLDWHDISNSGHGGKEL